MLKCHQKRAFDFMSAEAPSQAAMSADWMGSDLGAQAGPRFQINPAAMASPANKRYRGGAVGAMDIAGEGAGAGAEDLVARGTLGCRLERRRNLLFAYLASPLPPNFPLAFQVVIG